MRQYKLRKFTSSSLWPYKVLQYFLILSRNTILSVKSLQSCPTLCDPMDYSPPGILSMGFSMQEYWRGLPSFSPGDLLNPGIKTQFSHIADGFFTLWATREAQGFYYCSLFRINARFQADNYPEVNLPSLNIFGEQRYSSGPIPCEW